MSLSEAQKLTLRVLKQVMEEKLDHHNVQLAQVRALTSFMCGQLIRFYFRLHLRMDSRFWMRDS